MASTKGHLYLVLDDYTCVPLGVTSGEKAAREMFPDRSVRVLGPVVPGKPIDFDTVPEERYGPHAYGPISDYIPRPYTDEKLRPEYDKDYNPYAHMKGIPRNPDGTVMAKELWPAQEGHLQ